jgi:heat shock protein HslJ
VTEHRTMLIALGAGLVGMVAILVLAIASSSDGELDGSSWMLEELVVDDEAVPVVEGTAPSIAFDDGTVEGDGGCNNFFGRYETDADTLSIGELGSTMRFCEEPAGVSDQEVTYLAYLAEVSTFRIDDDRLILGDGSTDMLRFSSQ